MTEELTTSLLVWQFIRFSHNRNVCQYYWSVCGSSYGASVSLKLNYFLSRKSETRSARDELIYSNVKKFRKECVSIYEYPSNKKKPKKEKKIIKFIFFSWKCRPADRGNCSCCRWHCFKIYELMVLLFYAFEISLWISYPR